MKPYNCIIVDDEEIDLLITLSHVKKVPFLTVIGVCKTAFEALDIIEKQKVDVLFLDIDMPAIDGFELRNMVLDIPVCIYITSYPEYALEGYENSAFDFILKPIGVNRFNDSMRRLHDYLEMLSRVDFLESRFEENALHLKEGNSEVKINSDDVMYLEALKDYTKIVTPAKAYRVRTSLGNMISENNFKDLIRIHRSYAVNKLFVDSMSSQEVWLSNNVQIPVGRNYKDSLKVLKL